MRVTSFEVALSRALLTPCARALSRTLVTPCSLSLSLSLPLSLFLPPSLSLSLCASALFREHTQVQVALLALHFN